MTLAGPPATSPRLFYATHLCRLDALAFSRSAFCNIYPLGTPVSGPTALCVSGLFLSKVMVVLCKGFANRANTLRAQWKVILYDLQVSCLHEWFGPVLQFRYACLCYSVSALCVFWCSRHGWETSLFELKSQCFLIFYEEYSTCFASPADVVDADHPEWGFRSPPFVIDQKLFALVVFLAT